ncbi:MAG: hypothetical protein ACK5KP_05200 [Paludibacteraceae bacterium]
MFDFLNDLGFLYGTIWDLLLILFLIVLIIYIVRKYIVSSIQQRKIIRFAISSIIILFFSFVSIVVLIDYITARKDYKEWLNYYMEKAQRGINEDLIELKYYGMFTITKETNKIDSITKGFGVKLISSGDDMYDGPLIEKAKDKYDEITNSYLDKRNGTDWKQRMDKELEPYINRW